MPVVKNQGRGYRETFLRYSALKLYNPVFPKIVAQKVLPKPHICTEERKKSIFIR